LTIIKEEDNEEVESEYKESAIGRTKAQKRCPKSNDIRAAKRKTDRKARGFDRDPWARHKKNSSRGEEESNEGEDEAGERDKDKDKDSEEIDSEYED